MLCLALGFLTHSARGLRILSHTPPAVSRWPTATSAVCRVSAHIIFTHKPIYNSYTQTSSSYMLHFLLTHFDAVQPKLRGMWVDTAEDDGGGNGHVTAHMKYKSVILAFKVTIGSSSTYIESIVKAYIPSWSLFSENEGRPLIIPWLRTKCNATPFSGGCSMLKLVLFALCRFFHIFPTPESTSIQNLHMFLITMWICLDISNNIVHSCTIRYLVPL